MPESFTCEADLQALVDRQVSENWQLEFKRDFKRDSKGNLSHDAKHEFLADVTAMANTHGGQIIYGITDSDGMACSLEGFKVVGKDSFVLSLSNIIRDSVQPRLSAWDFKWIDLANGRSCLVVTIPRSWIYPHAVVNGFSFRFYVRNPNGKNPMDLNQVRQAFLASGTSRIKAIEYRDQRFQEITTESLFVGGPFPKEFVYGPIVVLHLIPALHGEGVINADPEVVRKLLEATSPPTFLFSSWTPCFDGFKATSKSQLDGKIHRFLLFSRDGVLETVVSDFLCNTGESHWLPADYEVSIVGLVQAFLPVMKELGIPLPVFAFLSFRAYHGKSIYNPDINELFRQNRGKMSRDPMLSFPVTIEDYDCDVPSVLKPLFDAVWNECGEKQSCNFDSDGKWKF